MERLKRLLARVRAALRRVDLARWRAELRDRRRKRNAVKRLKRADILSRDRLEALLEDLDPDSARAARVEARIDTLDRRIAVRARRQGRISALVRTLIEVVNGRAARRQRLEGKRRRIRHRIAGLRREIADRPEWPATLQVAELLYHDPPHCHLASPERQKLIEIGRIAVNWGIRVGEFPPFDPVECVHVSGSWHYRDSSAPWTPRDCSWRGDGLAMDLNDADGGSDKEVAFYHELVRRYG